MGLYNRVCRQCGQPFKGGPRAWYCPQCRAERKREASERFCKKGRRADRPIGALDYCVLCGAVYSVNSARQRYCSECAEKVYKEIDRKQAIDYYNKNKDDINHKKSVARKKLSTCIVCGNQFDANGTRRNTCSEDCQKAKVRIYRKQRR